MTPLARRLLDLLPQTQCTRCGFEDCQAYAVALADGQTAPNRCPPGGEAGVQALAQVLGQAAARLDPSCGVEAPRQLAVIDAPWCIGCTLCLDACPVDAILGGNKFLHRVIDDACTGCEKCLPVCPTDCIQMRHHPGPGVADWTSDDADRARTRYAIHQRRRQSASSPPTPKLPEGPTQGRDAKFGAATAAELALERARNRRLKPGP